MEQMFPLSYLQSMSLLRYMDWDLVKAQSGIVIGRISNHAAFPVGHSREILKLLPGSMKQEFPIGESPKKTTTFISRFMEVKGEFSHSDFQTSDGYTRRKPLGSEDGRQHPQGGGGTTVPVRIVSRR